MAPSLTTAWFGEFKGEQFQHLPPSKNYNPEDPYADPVAKLEHRDAVVREKFVHVAKCQIIRDELQNCYRREGVNHYKKCGHLAKKYVEMIKGAGVHRINHDTDVPAGEY